MFKTLYAVGGLIQVIGALVPIGAFLLTLQFIGSPYLTGLAITYGLSGIVTGAILYGFGGLIRVNIINAKNNAIAARALNRLVQQRTGVAEEIMPPPPMATRARR